MTAETRLPESATGGIEVEERLDVERIELDGRAPTGVESLGWDTARPGEVPAPALRVSEPAEALPESSLGPALPESFARLEGEQLRLAAELAGLREAAAGRERTLEQQLHEAKAQIEAREAELSEQFAQIASLTLECDGLRARLGDRERRPGAATVSGALDGHERHDSTDRETSLRERLQERGRALKLAQEESRKLRRERATLAEALAERGEQVATLLARLARAEVRRSDEGDFRRGLRRLFRRAAHDDAGSAASTAATTVTALGSAEAPPPAAPDATRSADPLAAAAAGSDGRSGAESPTARMRLQMARREMAARYTEQEPPLPRAHPSPALRRYLIALDPDLDEVCELSRPRMYVGRGTEADLRIADATVSRLHGIICLEQGMTVIEDACSTNGVFVNNRRVRRAALRDGDTVTFGTVRYQYRTGPAAGELA